MGLYGIDGFLGKFARLLRSDVAQKKIIQEAFKQRFGIDLTSDCILMKEGIVTIKCHPALKQRIYMEKGKLLEEINSFLPENAIKDIR